METKAADIEKFPESQLKGKAVDLAELRLRGAELNDDLMEKKTKPLIDEFLHNNDFEEKEKLKRSVQGILNKLTPWKFETLLSQLKNLSIDTEEKLNIVIDLIFEKAVGEPNFSVPIANMCKHLAMIKVPTENKGCVNFGELLLTKCRKEFEPDRSDEIKHEKKLKALEVAAPDKKMELEQEMYDEVKKMRYRQLGNIWFIGELFKLNMLNEPIMHECIKRLLSQGDEESLECLCRLLKTIGKELDEGKSKNSRETMEAFFNEMQKIVETCSRVRFMLQDVIDLKRSNWVPRRDENNPRTIDQIHKEACEQQQVLQTRNIVTAEEGWTSLYKSNKGSYSIVDPNKLELTKPDEVETLRLGPGRAMQSWGRGSSEGTKAPVGSSDPDDKEKEKLKGSVQGILNKLTPWKFETLLSQMKNLNIDTEEKLNIVIDLIFEKAVGEPNLRVPIANMCKHLAMIKVPTTEYKGYVNFRKLLLTKCQEEFEQDRSYEEKLKALEEASPDKKIELEQEMYAEEKKMRYRQLGNISFTGELFKLNMLIEPIMHECIKRLLSQGDEESLECLCRLLKTIGKELDEGKNKNSREAMEAYFNEMQKIVDKRLKSSRVRFMLQDVIDLKRDNWIPRRGENNPKTICQIHKEAEQETGEQQQVLQTRNIVTSGEGWTSSTKSNKGRYSIVDPNKLKLTKPDEVETLRLGPGRSMQSWGRVSSGKTKAPASSSDPDKTTLQSRYSALTEQPSNPSFMENRKVSQRSAASSRESSPSCNAQLFPAIRKTPSTSKERDNVIEAVKGLVRGGTAIETKAGDIKKTPEPQLNGKAVDSADLRLGGVELNAHVMEKKTKHLIDEFLHNNDFEEAVRRVTELASPSTIHMFINFAINQVLERSSQARHSLGQLLFSLVKQKIITFDQYKKGFICVLELVDEFALDIPLIWDYIGEILEPMLEDNKYPLTFLKEVLQPCIPSETAGMLVSATLHCAAKKRGTIKLGELWRESNLQWTDFLGENANVEEFIQKHKLEFTICSVKVKSVTPMSREEIKKHLLDLLEKTEKSEEIIDWIGANVSENTEPSFIRALVSAVHENAIKDSRRGCELDVTKLRKRTSILNRYIDHNENLELQALYAIQSLMNQLDQPKGILRQIFDILYDDDVIIEESFKNWEQSDDANEVEGKEVALHSVRSFFTWLKETDSGDSMTDE